ncbi:GNAT family N-acetyltransferase [Mycoplasmatota bacterium WC44]
MKTLETKRLILREFILSDLEDFYEYCKDENVGPMAGWQPHDNIHDSKEKLEKMITNQEVWGIYHKADKKIIGSIGLHKRSKRNKKELGFVLSKAYWGQGIMPEAGKRVIKYAFEEENINKIEINHFDFNNQSKSVIKKLGFTYEGTKRQDCEYKGKLVDSIGYSLLKSEYDKYNDDIRVLETKRLIIRKFKNDDLDDMFEYANDPNVGPSAGWPPHKNKSETKVILNRFVGSNEHRAIVLKDTGKMIGGISLMKTEGSSINKREIGYVLNRDYWGQGLMPEACSELIKYGFEEKKLDKIEIFHYPFNKQSKRVIEKMGFLYEGTRRQDFRRYDGEVFDSLGYSMLRSDYEEAIVAFDKKYPKEEL